MIRRRNDGGAETSITASKRSSKLKDGRSRSLTQIDSLDPSILTGGKLDMESKSGPISCSSEQVLLLTPPPDARISPKTSSNLVGSQRGKNRFFSSSTEEPAVSTAGNMCEGTDSLSAPTTNLHTAQGSSDPNLNVSSSAAASAAKKRSLLSLSSPRHQPRQNSRAPSGFISHEGSLKLKNTKHNRWSSLFSPTIKDNSKMDLLSHYLEQYEQFGIPRPSILPCDNDDMESKWKLSPDSSKSTYKAKHLISMKESVCLSFPAVNTIEEDWRLILFLACLYNLQAANILNDIDRDRIFSNICDVYKSNKVLWLDCMLPMVQKARDSKQPFQPSELHSGFTQYYLPTLHSVLFGSIVSPGLLQEDGSAQSIVQSYLAWCETRKECNRERLTDILVRPLQRLTKYSLLLKAILKYTDDTEDRQCLEEMILSVERFVKSVNGALRSQQESERLHAIMDRIENYEVVETRDDELESVIKSHSKLNLFAPMPGCGNAKRWLIFDSDMRLRDSFSSKIDVHCFLFTDMLLICKSTTRKGEKLKVIRQPYAVDRILTREFVKDTCAFGLVYLNEFGTADAALSLHGHESKLVKLWLENIRNARRLYLTARAKANANFDIPLTEVDVDDFSAAEPGLEIEEDENSGMIYLHSQSPREVSSRVSQLSSLLHSHSGSIEMNDSSRAVSFEHELRGSSLSSDDGNSNEQAAAGANSTVARSLSVETGNLRPSSPRTERRSFLSTSPTPNTLSVQIPVSGYSGQSLPNLTSAYESSATHVHSLTVPKCLSPTNRGVSYPPPSPRSLRRTKALLQSAKPPLQKSKHVANDCKSPEKSASLAASISVDRSHIIPEATIDITPHKSPATRDCMMTIDITPPSKDVSPVAPHPEGKSFLAKPSEPYCSLQERVPQSSYSTRGSVFCSAFSNSRGPSRREGRLRLPHQTLLELSFLLLELRGDLREAIVLIPNDIILQVSLKISRKRIVLIRCQHSQETLLELWPQSQNSQHQLAADAAVLKNRHFFSCEKHDQCSSTSSILGIVLVIWKRQDIPEEHSSIATSSNPSCPDSPHLHRPDVLIAVSEPDRDDEEDSDAEYGGVSSSSMNKEHSSTGRYTPEKVIWDGTDNPAFDGDFSREATEQSNPGTSTQRPSILGGSTFS
ncbi:Pleckstrin y domain-containing family G member 5 [Orchesella cincta]|uniref:Pleckstrin y domain-containing family G member 5 n=1 Tax=Orchesella cincta TaxID=48709 RepID=A0A1D2MD25_ORCCI|nr:Pleckstrin y domain-containing family G member 5 [Orchesella cincta]